MEKRGPPYKLWWLYFTSYDSYRLMASAFSDSLMASGGWKHPIEISKTAKGMIITLLPHVGTHMKVQNQKKV